MLNLLRRPAVTFAALDYSLAELGLNGTQHVILHASLKSFGNLEGGAKTLIDALEQRTATLVAPAFSYATLLIHSTDRPRSQFNRDTRVSRDIGRSAQVLVERAAAERSFHPTLSFIAVGEAAGQVVACQTLESPYQPIGALYDLDGYVLLAGVDFGSNTTIHYGEYLAGVPALTRYVAVGGQVVPTAFPNCSADFDNLLPEVQFLGRQVEVGGSLLRLYRVRDLVDATVRFLERDPEGLLCTFKGCRCQQVRALIRQDGLHPRPHVHGAAIHGSDSDSANADRVDAAGKA